jgi:mono/diheme cytochrome c family protein
MRSLGLFVIASLASGAASARSLSVDSSRGERLFESQGCIQCHSIDGKGGKIAPDLGKRIGRNYTPALLASVMWNHAPTMWTAMDRQGVRPAPLDEQAAADIFAYFYAVRFFDKPGDAARGKRLFSSKHCSECHGINTSKVADAKPVIQWQALGHPILLAEAMWNHAANMRQAFAQQKISWPEISGQDLTDMLVYLRNLPATRQSGARLETGAGEKGEALFQSKGCAGCHTGKLELAPRLKGQTLTEIAADMWDHAPKMAQPPPKLEQGEMRQIVSYLWTQSIFQDIGNPVEGKKVFASKNCAVCHNDASSGAPNLASRRGVFSTISMISTLWRHGPRMLQGMEAKRLAWPKFTARQMSDLISYLNAGSQQ